MADTIINNSVIGTVPVFDPERGWRQWSVSEIYTGPMGAGRYVPNIDDAVLNWSQGWLRVSDVDPTTGLSTLVAWTFPGSAGVPEQDVLLGVGPGRQSETFRLYMDASVIPHRICADSRLHVYGESNAHYKVFKGTDITQSGMVISAYYNQSGDFVSENVPLELVERVDANNLSVKAPSPGYSNYQLNDGEPVTLVVYGQNGVSSINVLLVKNTAFIRASESPQRYITHIALESPFISPTDLNTLQVPTNVPLDSVLTMGRVYYSDGGNRRVPIDGTKLSVFGMNNYISTILGQRAPLVLSYKLGPEEYSTDSVNGQSKHISRNYFAESIAAVGAYSLKLFVAPKWISEIVGWQLDYYLCNLDRGDLFYATPYVEPSVNSAPFDPSLIGQTQWITVAVDVNLIDPRLAAYRHVQNFAITIFNHGLAETTAWTVQYSSGQQPPYGENLRAVASLVNIGNWLVDITNGYVAVEPWLEAVFYRTQPLFDPKTETRAPQPTHFILNLNGIRNEYPLAAWNSALASPTGGLEGRSALIEWRRKVGGTTLQLGVSPLRIVHDLDGTQTPQEVNLYPAWTTAIGETSTNIFAAGTSDLRFSSAGNAEALWNGTTFTWGDGADFAAHGYEIRVSIVDRFMSANQLNYLYVTTTPSVFIPLTDNFTIGIREQGMVPIGNGFITLEVAIRRVSNPAHLVVSNFTLRKGS